MLVIGHYRIRARGVYYRYVLQPVQINFNFLNIAKNHIICLSPETALWTLFAFMSYNTDLVRRWKHSWLQDIAPDKGINKSALSYVWLQII